VIARLYARLPRRVRDALELTAIAAIGAAVVGLLVFGDYACARMWCDQPAYVGRHGFVCLPGAR
jgi:hypothetical protein